MTFTYAQQQRGIFAVACYRDGAPDGHLRSFVSYLAAASALADHAVWCIQAGGPSKVVYAGDTLEVWSGSRVSSFAVEFISMLPDGEVWPGWTRGEDGRVVIPTREQMEAGA